MNLSRRVGTIVPMRIKFTIKLQTFHHLPPSKGDTLIAAYVSIRA